MNSNEMHKIISDVKELCKVLENEGFEPVTQIQGFILSGDPAYLRVHTGGNRELKNKVAKMDSHRILEAVLMLALK